RVLSRSWTRKASCSITLRTRDNKGLRAGGRLLGERMLRIAPGWAAVCLAAAFVIDPSRAAAADHPLQEVLSKIDQAASHFKSLAADVEYVSHMEAIHENDSETGTILVRRQRPKDLHVKISIVKPEEKVAVTDGKQVEVYYPRSGEIQRVQLGHRRSLVDLILTLG